MNKSELRRHIRSRRPHIVAASDVWKRIESLTEFKAAETVLMFWSLPDEIPTHEVVSRWAAYKSVILPCVSGEDLELRRFMPDKLREGAFGIMEPVSEASAVEPSEIDLAVIPGVGFDIHGNRLGRGKGFYDRLLPKLNCVKIGVAMPHQIVDSVPVEPHDIPVDRIFY